MVECIHIFYICQSPFLWYLIYFVFDRILCDTVKDFITKVSDVGVLHDDKDLNEKCYYLKSKLSHLLNVLKDEQLFFNGSFNVIILYFLLILL